MNTEFLHTRDSNTNFNSADSWTQDGTPQLKHKKHKRNNVWNSGLDKGQTSQTQPKEQENRTDRLRSLSCGYRKPRQWLPGPVTCLIKDERPGPNNHGQTTGDRQPTGETTHTMWTWRDNTRPTTVPGPLPHTRAAWPMSVVVLEAERPSTLNRTRRTEHNKDKPWSR